MSAPSITILYNNSNNDTANTGNASGDSNWNILDPVNDKISFVDTTVHDGDSNGSKGIFKIPESGSKEVPKQAINNYSAGVWKRVYLAGSNADDGLGGNYRYVYGVFIDGTTASAPILQAWDSTSHSSYNLQVLGSGTPANSMLRGVATTNSSPGDSWSGIPLAGDGYSNTVALDTGAVTSSKMLYWNMRLLVPSTATSFRVNPILTIYFTYS